MQLQIEKLVYGGDGLARLPADDKGQGKTVFVPFVIPGETVQAKITESRPGFARASLESVVEASSERIHPVCPYFKRCGGCHYQHIDYKAQLRFKAEILRETLRRTAKLDLPCEIQIHGCQPWQYRNRTRVRVQTVPRFAIGYNSAGSQELLPIEGCPISSPLINRAIDAALAAGGKAPSSLHGLQFFARDEPDGRMLVEAYVRPGASAGDVQPFAAQLRAAVPEISGVLVFATSGTDDEAHQRAPLSVTPGEEFQAIGDESLLYTVAGHGYRVSGGSFFQTNRFLVDELARRAVQNITGRAALDLYAGVGLFTVPLSKNFDQVIAVEGSPHSFADLRQNAPSNVKPVRASVERFLQERGPKLAPDLVLVDPPRAGLGKESAAALGRMSVPRVTYVSCDPATLSRDLRVLLESGFRVEQAHLFDLFPQTYHMETVLHLVR